MHEWKSNFVSNQFGGIFSTIMSRYSEERVRVHRFFKQNELGELKKTGVFKLLLSPHVPSSHGTCDACDVLNSVLINFCPSTLLFFSHMTSWVT